MLLKLTQVTLPAGEGHRSDPSPAQSMRGLLAQPLSLVPEPSAFPSFLSWWPQDSLVAGGIVHSLIFQMRKLRHREGQPRAQGHTGRVVGIWGVGSMVALALI